MLKNSLLLKLHIPIMEVKKNLNFDINKFKKFKDKIEYIVVDAEPRNILKSNKRRIKR